MADYGKKSIPETSDRLTELPDDILHSILSFLPVRNIVQTSVLSKEWENKWKELWLYSAKLEFNRDFAPYLERENYADFVDTILKQHKLDFIQKFQLFFFPGRDYGSATREWIELVLEKGVQELELNLRGSLARRNIQSQVIRGSLDFQSLPDSLYSSSSLTSLQLSYCCFRLPLNSTGFNSLKCLTLNWVNISGESIGKILEHSPFLEQLVLKSCGPLEGTRINSLRLKNLIIDSCWDDEQIEIFAPILDKFYFSTYTSRTPVLRDVSSLDEAVVHIMDESESLSGVSWLRFLSGLSHVRKLSMMLQAYPEGAINVPNITFDNLRELELYCFWSQYDSYDIRMFFTCCSFPSMEKLTITLALETLLWLQDDNELERFEANPEVPLRREFRRLREIKIRNFLGREHEVKLVKLLLGITPVLEVLEMEFPMRSTFGYMEVPSGDLYNQLPRVPRASPDARIVFSGYIMGWRRQLSNLNAVLRAAN